MTTSSLPRKTYSGFSLLEVLVACGILVIGLASIAAVLPAAGSRLSEAAAQDRAMAAVAVAMSEIRCRNLLNQSIFPSGTWTVTSNTLPPRTVVFGETLSLAVTPSVIAAGYVTTTGSLAITSTSGSVSLVGSGTVPAQALLSGTSTALITPVPAIINTAINNDTTFDDRRGYFLEDEVQYQAATTGDLPLNSFVNGVRQFNRGVCWGAMITPVPWGVTTGSITAARVSVAVFRKPGGVATAMTLTSSTSGTAAAAGIFMLSGSSTPATIQRTILKPCSTVLAIGGSAAPQWLAIRSSWISGTNPMSTLSSATTCVVFENANSVAPFISGSTLNVIGFENLLLVNEQVFSLQ